MLGAGAVTTGRAELGHLGGEFRVNTYTTGTQGVPRVAADPAGKFVVVWQSGGYSAGPDGSRTAIAAQRFDSGGLPLGSEFIVNTYTLGSQNTPAISADALGNFVVAWESGSFYGPGPDGSAMGAFVRSFSHTGVPLSGELRANTFTVGLQRAPAVARAPNGGFVVVWQSGTYYGAGQDGSAIGIFGQRFDSSASPVGPEFQINTYTTGKQSRPAVATDASGNFVVAWQSTAYPGPGQDGDESGIFARRFDSAGLPLTPEFQVNTYTTGYQSQPAVAMEAGGSFVVVWESGSYYGGQDGSSLGVFGQRFDSSGAPAGPEFRVNTETLQNQENASVSVGQAGTFTVVWSSGGYYSQDVVGQHFAATGTPLGSEFRVNTYTTDAQGVPAVAATPVGDFVVTWASSGYPSQDGSGAGVFGQRFQTTAVTPPAPVSGALLMLKLGAGGAQKGMALRSRDVEMTLGAGNGSADDPTLTGGRLRVRSGSFDVTYEMPAANWHYTGRPGGNVGYRYADPRLVSGPLRSARVQNGRLLKAVGKGPLLGHILATNPDPVVVVLQIGSTGHRYCLEFGGRTRFVPGQFFRATAAPAPAPCPP
jgi:hypothetical protein